MRPASRRFRRELDEKLERLKARLTRYGAGELPLGQNPGFDRMAEALFLKGEWDRSKDFGRSAAEHWRGVVEATVDEQSRAEPSFHLGSACLFADDVAAARDAFASGVLLYVAGGLAASDDTGYMATVAGDLRRAEVVFHAAAVADMTAQGILDLKVFATRFPDTPRLLKLKFARGLARKDRPLILEMRRIERWLTPEPEGITSFRTEEWFYAAHQAVLAQMDRGEDPAFRLYDDAVVRGLVDAAPR